MKLGFLNNSLNFSNQQKCFLSKMHYMSSMRIDKKKSEKVDYPRLLSPKP